MVKETFQNIPILKTLKSLLNKLDVLTEVSNLLKLKVTDLQ